MYRSKINLRFGVLFLIVISAAFSRLLPHPPNFTPIGAMALFGAAYFSKKYLAIILPIIAMFLSDLVINNVVYAQYFDGFTFFYPGFYWTYGAFVVIGLIGFFALKKIQLKTIVFSSLFSALAFFLISNFGVWASGITYTKDFSGLLLCYTAAIPFFKNSMMGNLVYAGVLFGAFELAQYKFPVLRLNPLTN